VAVSFMLAYGLEYAVDQWKKHDTHTVTCFAYRASTSMPWACSPTQAAQYWADYKNSIETASSCYSGATGTVTYTKHYTVASAGASSFVLNYTNKNGTTCADIVSQATFGWQATTTTSVTEPYLRTAVDGDFTVPTGDPVPDGLPEVLPVPLPVLPPDINPIPAPNGDPTPLRVPTGDPVALPGTSPQQYEKPYIDIRPSPTQPEPWRVDVVPGKITDTSPTPIPEPTGATSPDNKPEETATAPNDPALPAVPDLYTRKYPDGIAGVWTARKAEILGGPIFTFLASLVPSIGDGGCPSFSLGSGSVLGIEVGGALNVPCGVWTFARLVMIISALLLARRLIFGG
jgi:hypothetical protein